MSKSDLEGVIIIEQAMWNDLRPHDPMKEDLVVWRFWHQGPSVPDRQGEWLELADFLAVIATAMAKITGANL